MNGEDKVVYLGTGDYIVATAATEEEVGVESEVLILRSPVKQEVGESTDHILPLGTVIETGDPRTIVRLVLVHPDGADVLIEKLQKVRDAMRKAWEHNPDHRAP